MTKDHAVVIGRNGRIDRHRIRCPGRKTLRSDVKAKIIYRKGKHPVGDIGRPITREEIKNALAEFP